MTGVAPAAAAPMEKNTTVNCLLLLAAAALLVQGCASPNVNPARARANTGYVDFHADSPFELSWDVARFDDRAQTFKSLFSDLKPPPGGVLRLAFTPGGHRLRITFLNCVIMEPVEVEVEVQDGKITPVRIILTEAGTALVQSRQASRGVNYNGRYGRRLENRSIESATYSLSAEPGAPAVYQLKEQMPYAH
jgi:hypothetical protein